MAKGRKTGGRAKGVPNRATRDVREAIAEFASANVDRMGRWLSEIETDDPGRAMDLYLRAIEYHIPKLARTEVTLSQTSDDQLLAEVKRRAAAVLGETPKP